MTANPGVARGALPLPPPEYSQQHMNQLVRQLETIFNQFQALGPVTCGPVPGANSRAKSGLNIVNIPTSTTGLKSGDVWSDGGTLKIVT
jgi:hypothetical protein